MECGSAAKRLPALLQPGAGGRMSRRSSGYRNPPRPSKKLDLLRVVRHRVSRCRGSRIGIACFYWPLHRCRSGRRSRRSRRSHRCLRPSLLRGRPAAAGEGWQLQTLHLAIVALALSATAAFVIQALVALTALKTIPGAHHLAFIRTLTLCAASLALVFGGARWRRLELTRLGYATLVLLRSSWSPKTCATATSPTLPAPSFFSPSPSSQRRAWRVSGKKRDVVSPLVSSGKNLRQQFCGS